ncbi:hypothetical protein Q428_00750 [Fervidicella metallireducens AeB]|uniref:Uncharacterized protein n=1 Tax=Fervidicella metallireducens AeB TaxID=1403537 RepID=A0A017RYY1_9CLOT|nr:hypothetical protein [Fervidicella metallireducens]EYE89887.1 hypothetical protein Q428_00750 [Fervidicella metallireducens AeB]
MLDRCLDFRAIKNRSKKILNQRNLAPLYISESEILIPVKVRKPRVSRDGGYGYLNINTIKEIKDKYLILNNGEKIIFKDSNRTIIKRIKMARILKERVAQSYISTNIEITGKEYLVMEGIEEILKQINLIKTTMERKGNI